MNGTNANWRKAILMRFADRENIGKEALFERYFMRDGLPRVSVLECLELIESEYKIPSGLLRPEDKLTKLLEPVRTKNPWRWLVYQTHEGDSESELSYQLSRRMRQHGNNESWPRIETIGEFIRAWCGQKPT